MTNLKFQHFRCSILKKFGLFFVIFCSSSSWADPIPAIARQPLSLATIIEFALAHNPSLQFANSQIHFTQAGVGISQSTYWPQLSTNLQTAENASTGVDSQANLSLSYLLWDFGSRSNLLKASQNQLVAAQFSQNRVVQQVIFQTQQSYYQALGQQALITAYQKSLEEAQLNLKVANTLRTQGLATIGDVYQSRASEAQADLNLLKAREQYQLAIGQLATVMGLAADTPLKLIPLQTTPPIYAFKQHVHDLVYKATLDRPDLLAAAAQVNASEAQLAAARASDLPKIRLSGTTGSQFEDNHSLQSQMALNVSFPLFTGYQYTNQVKQAGANVEASEANWSQLRTQVQSDVWQAYQALDLSEKSIKDTDNLLKSNEQAVKQALGQYKAGIGNILSVLTTQAALANARVESIQARLNWYVALAQLAQAVGTPVMTQ